MTPKRIGSFLALALMVSAMVAPTASAMTAVFSPGPTSDSVRHGPYAGAQPGLAGSATKDSLSTPGLNGSGLVGFANQNRSGAPRSGSGFDWGDAAIGAGAAIALAMIGLGGALVIRSGRRGHGRLNPSA
jgi:hypothetical protein